MKATSQDIESKGELQPMVQDCDEGETEQTNTIVTDEPLGDSCSLSAADDGKKVSREDIELVQNLIERCLQLYMNRGEVVRTLSTRARIEPGFTTLGKDFILILSSDSFGNNAIALSVQTK